VFRKASTKRAYEDIVNQIRDAIVQGRLQPGDRLPSQRELKEMFQVSRATVMESLRVLEKADLITIRPGAAGGAFVSHATSDTVAESLHLLLSLEGVTLQELAEFRERLEGGTSFWAAQRATDEEIARLERLLEEVRRAANEGLPWQDFLAEERKIHAAIAEFSRNRPSAATMKAITRAMEEAYSYITPGLYDRVVEDMAGIVAAIRQRDPHLTEERMKIHIRFFNEDMVGNWIKYRRPFFRPGGGHQTRTTSDPSRHHARGVAGTAEGSSGGVQNPESTPIR